MCLFSIFCQVWESISRRYVWWPYVVYIINARQEILLEIKELYIVIRYMSIYYLCSTSVEAETRDAACRFDSVYQMPKNICSSTDQRTSSTTYFNIDKDHNMDHANMFLDVVFWVI